MTRTLFAVSYRIKIAYTKIPAVIEFKKIDRFSIFGIIGEFITDCINVEITIKVICSFDELEQALAGVRGAARELDNALDRVCIQIKRRRSSAYLNDHPHKTILINLEYSLDDVARTVSSSVAATSTISRTIQRTIG